jgi:formylglycine-generating enzyme required for sulfatase activity
LENRYNCFIYADHALILSIKNALTIHIHFLKIEVMKAVYSTCLLALIFAASAEVRAFPAFLSPAVAETRLAAQQERSQPRESERPPSAAPIQNKTNNACPNCPELISIPGSKFAIGKFAVTFDEWDACVTDGGCGGYQPLDNGWGRGKRPVINVSWDNAQAYIQWLSRKTGKNYRLPSEEEWEIAARAGTATNYYWGNDVGRNNANCDGCGSEWDNRKTAPVGSFKPNAFGLYDMMGNVWQWTDTCWQGNCAKRVFCGGSWNHRPEDMRATTRNWFDTTKRMRYLGFRLAMTLP